MRRVVLALLVAAACGDDGPPKEATPPGRLAGFSDQQWGEHIFQTHGCLACHRIDGVPSVGPPLDRIVGTTRNLEDGRQMEVDADYLEESLVSPEAYLLPGYEPVMPSYEALLEPVEREALIRYLTSLTRGVP